MHHCQCQFTCLDGHGLSIPGFGLGVVNITVTSVVAYYTVRQKTSMQFYFRLEILYYSRSLVSSEVITRFYSVLSHLKNIYFSSYSVLIFENFFSFLYSSS